MFSLIDKFENFLLALCTLSDNSFWKLFVTYFIFILMYAFFSKNLEKYLGYQNEVRLYDVVFILLVFAMFAWNSHYLYKVKVQIGTPSFKIKD